MHGAGRIAMITTLGEILPHATRKHADRTALMVENRRFSFHELDALSNRIANGLIAGGIEPGWEVW
jgi:long-chain acyl-CoA synthetase